jgi:hypothetical protein
VHKANIVLLTFTRPPASTLACVREGVQRALSFRIRYAQFYPSCCWTKTYSSIPVYNFHPTQNIFTTQVMRLFCHFSTHANEQRRENCQCVQGVAAHQAAQSTFTSSNVVIVAGDGIVPMRECNDVAAIAAKSPEGGNVVVVPLRLPNYVSDNTAGNGENAMIEQQIRVQPPRRPCCLLRHRLIHSATKHRGAMLKRPSLTSSNASNDGWSTR